MFEHAKQENKKDEKAKSSADNSGGPSAEMPLYLTNGFSYGIVQRKLKIEGSTIFPDGITDENQIDTDVDVEDAKLTSKAKEVIATTKTKLDPDPGKGTLIQALTTHNDAYEKQLKKWIHSKVGGATGKTHTEIPNDVSGGKFGRKRQERKYDTYINFAKGLIGWVDAKEGRKREKNLALQIYGKKETADGKNVGADIQKSLDAIIRKMQAKLAESTEETLTVSGGKTFDGEYLAYMKGIKKKAANPTKDTKILSVYPHIGANIDFLTFAKTPLVSSDKSTSPDMTFQEKVALIHDYMILVKKKPDLLPGSEPTDEETMLTTEINKTNKKRTTSASIMEKIKLTKKAETSKVGEDIEAAKKLERSTRGSVDNMTRDETSASTILARERKQPVWAGQSMTTAWMMKVGQNLLTEPDTTADTGGEISPVSGEQNAAKKKEVNAHLKNLALALAAYWRLDYDHTSTMAYHTFYEVMDIAQNFFLTGDKIFYDLDAVEKDIKELTPASAPTPTDETGTE